VAAEYVGEISGCTIVYVHLVGAAEENKFIKMHE
jgi:hypothetical protein